jgi:hypothetical protein
MCRDKVAVLTQICPSVTGDAMNSFIAENWRLVLDQIGKPSYKALGMIVHQILSEVAHKVPYDELFSDTD